MAKTIKRIEITLEIDDEREVTTRNMVASKNLNIYEIIGLLDEIRVDVIKGLHSHMPESEVTSEPTPEQP